jgi:hypothetical protein
MHSVRVLSFLAMSEHVPTLAFASHLGANVPSSRLVLHKTDEEHSLEFTSPTSLSNSSMKSRTQGLNFAGELVLRIEDPLSFFRRSAFSRWKYLWRDAESDVETKYRLIPRPADLPTVHHLRVTQATAATGSGCNAYSGL